MTWQEYQEAVAQLYDQLDDIGVVHRNVTIPDKITGQPRQIDVLVEIQAYDHTIYLVVDAKFHSDKLDVKNIEEVLALASAVKASQVAIVAANGWTEPAAKKAAFENCTLRLLTLESALDLLIEDKWAMCPNCKKDCIVLDLDGATGYGVGELQGWFWWLAGRCRQCKYGFVWCQDCGSNFELPFSTNVSCGCGHEWFSNDEGLFIRFNAEEDDYKDEEDDYEDREADKGEGEDKQLRFDFD